MKNTRVLLLVSAIVIELTAVLMITKAYIFHSSTTTGLLFLTIGLTFLVIGIAKKPRTADRHQSRDGRNHAQQ